MSQRKLIVFICMSLDGFIATKEDDLSWLSIVDKEGEDYGYSEFTSRISSYIVGRKTYDKVLQMAGEFPPAKQFDCFVMSRSKTGKENGVTFYTGDIRDLVFKLKQSSEKDIYCDGGGEIVKLLMEYGLIDEYIISIIPTLLGDGKRLFAGGVPPGKIKLEKVLRFDTGLVQLHYKSTD